METFANDRLAVAVLSGGDSAEREVSLQSGAAVAEALTSAGHRVTTIDPARRDLEGVDWRRFDACFIALHGGAGEDGRVQQLLERVGIPYTGSGPETSRLAMSKSASKQRFMAAGVPTLPFALVEQGDALRVIAARVAPLGYPLVVKPDGQGSSIGLAVADGPGELASAARCALDHDTLAVVEPLVRGREFTLATIDEQPLPLVEIVSHERVFSYDAKYASALTEYHLDFELDERKRAEVAYWGAAAARSLGTTGLARTDVMLDVEGRVWVLEVNTVPGLTSRSLAPQAAERAGLDFALLCDRLVRQCLARESVA